VLARWRGGRSPGRDARAGAGQVGVGLRLKRWPALVASSLLVSRPCANASLSASITRSRSASEARRWRPPAAHPALGSFGSIVTGRLRAGPAHKSDGSGPAIPPDRPFHGRRGSARARGTALPVPGRSQPTVAKDSKTRVTGHPGNRRSGVRVSVTCLDARNPE
jgi:hypothetical protein